MHILSINLSSYSIPEYFFATSLATVKNKPSVNFIIFALVIAVTFFLLCFIAYSNANLTILSEANFDIGLMLIAESILILFLDNSIIFFDSSDPASNSTPAYKSSVFSLTITRSIFSYFDFTPLYVLQGLRQVYKSNSFLRATFTERKPLPIGVVIGPFIATLFLRMDLRTSSGSGVPYFSRTSQPASAISQSIFTPVASKTRLVDSAISGPVPSPGMSVIL